MRFGQLTSELQDQLNKVQPYSFPGMPDRYACRLVMKDGRVFDRVMLSEIQEEEVNWRDRWILPPLAGVLMKLGVIPKIMADGFPEETLEKFLKIEDVKSIESSPLQTPARIYGKIISAGETGMGYYQFELHLADGRSVRCFSSGEFEFLDLPTGVTPDMIVDVVPLERGAEDCIGCDARSYWCWFRRLG